MLSIFYGNDAFSRLEALQALKAELDTDGMLETNTVALPARQTTPQEVIAACDTVPFLASHRLVIVEGLLQAAPGGRGKRSKKTDVADEEGDAGPWQALVDYVGRMPPSTTLVLVDGDVSAGNTLLKLLEGKGAARHFKLPERPRDAAGWAMARARKTGLRLEAGAATLLADLAGTDTWLLANELQKLAAYAGGGPVREADVRELVGAARELKGYELSEAVVEGRAAQAVRLFHELLAQGQNSGGLVSTIEGRYRRIAVARDMMDAGATGGSIGARLGQKGFGLEKLLDQASRYPLARVKAALARIVQADVDIKRGVYDDDVSIDLMIQDLASAASSRAA